jgi:hypothetical protein
MPMGAHSFEDLMFRRGQLFFVAFDALCIDGEDLRGLPLIERKARLERGVYSPNHPISTSVFSLISRLHCGHFAASNYSRNFAVSPSSPRNIECLNNFRHPTHKRIR